MSQTSDNLVPLCVDLDGTLVRTDMLLETLLVLLKQQPWCVILVPFWLSKGKANLKHQIAQRVSDLPTVLPYTEEVVEYVQAERKKRKTVLITGSHHSIAQSIAKQTDLFDEVQGSTATVNLTNANKRDWLLERFGENGFDYIGNDKDDLTVWPAANEALVVSPSSGGIADTPDQTFSRVFNTTLPSVKDYLSMLRVHQWTKNLLIFVPFVLDQRFGEWLTLSNVIVTFFAMSLLASLTYILNDMLDLQSDRANEIKSKRALPSGKIAIMSGFKVMALLAVVLSFLMLLMPMAVNLLLVAYLIATLSYSFVLKRKPIVDVTMLAALHTHRIIIGVIAISAEWSFWLLAFSMFIFFSLAIAKRVSELMNLKKDNRSSAHGRAYYVNDIPVLLASGVASGYISVLIVALYVTSEKVQRMYGHPEILWLVCPILLYWVGRLWLITSRGELHEDPIVFAIRDKISLITVGIVFWVIAFAIAV